MEMGREHAAMTPVMLFLTERSAIDIPIAPAIARLRLEGGRTGEN
jgi:hypothetical protein